MQALTQARTSVEKRDVKKRHEDASKQKNEASIHFRPAMHFGAFSSVLLVLVALSINAKSQPDDHFLYNLHQPSSRASHSQ